jgi:hypothetical protein
MSIYTDNGHKDRTDYLKSLADDYGLRLDLVFALAAVLGPNEDFDGLVVALQDEADRIESIEETLFYAAKPKGRGNASWEAGVSEDGPI